MKSLLVTLIGRPAVGKTSLFKLLSVGKVPRNILPTRDRQFVDCNLQDNNFTLMDTGGLLLKKRDQFAELVYQQALNALSETNVVLFVVDGSVGVTYEDLDIIKIIRKYQVEIILIINKVDALADLSSFYELGINKILPINRLSKQIIADFSELLLSVCSNIRPLPLVNDNTDQINITIVGRPNVGKSTLINHLLGDERTIISDIPGTTLDRVEIPYEHKGKKFILVDTAGIRKKSKITDQLEQQTIYQSLHSINVSDITICLIDAVTGIVEQDLRLISHIIQLGKPLIIVANKIDLLSKEQKKSLLADIKFQLKHAKYLQIHQISAKIGLKVSVLMKLVHSTYYKIQQKIPTAKLNKILIAATTEHMPPLINRKRAKLKYAHMGSLNPHMIIIHGVRVKKLNIDYKRYLNNYFHKHLGLFGVQFRLVFRESHE